MPANRPDLALFDAAQQKDILAVYNERSDRNGAIHRRAYFLRKNEGRVAGLNPPIFVKPELSKGLPPIPVFLPSESFTNASPPPYYAVVSTNIVSFTVYTNQGVLGIYELPLYPDPVGRAERAALAPVAVTVDAALVALVVYGALWGATHDPDPLFSR